MKLTDSRTFSPNCHQQLVARLLQQVQSLGRVDAPGDAMTGQGVSGVVECQADVLLGGTGTAEVLHLVPAVADAHADMAGCPDDLRRPLVVQDMQGALRVQWRLVDEHPPQLGFALAEQLLDEILLDVEVLVQQLGQELLVDVAAQAHHGELEEAGHGGGRK